MKTKVDGIKISNPQKLVFKDDKITKLELINYYKEVAPLMLKHLSGRPLSVFRCHGENCAECFFKKHPSTEEEFVCSVSIDDKPYFFIKTRNQLIFQVQMGTIEFHTWGCKCQSIEQPDTMIFDLDPAEDVSLDKLRDGTLKLKSVLDELKLKTSLKTSGGKGYHVIVQLKKHKNWEDFADFSKQIALLLEAKWPNLFTTNMRKNKRNGKIFVDYLRNKRGSSCVCAFSVRARPHAPISFPIEWENLEDIKPNEVTIRNYKDYLKKFFRCTNSDK